MTTAPLTLPPLKKIAPSATSLTSFPYALDLTQLKNGERYYIGNTNFKDFLLSLLVKKKIILVFSTKAKLDIAKTILFETGIKNIGFAREEQTISSEQFTKFLNKDSFNQFELYFILKYCVHLFWGYGVLDLNSKGDYMVYNALKDERQVVKYPIVLTTHHGLYSLLEKDATLYADFSIAFFDVEWRYKNYNAYLSRTCDLYYIQNFIDILVYKYTSFEEKEHQTLQAFDTFFTMFLGILWTETKKLFIGRAEESLQINPLVNNLDFYQTNLLLPKLEAFKEPLQSSLSEQDFHTLWKQIEHFLAICETIAKVDRKMYGQNGSDFYFLFSEEAKFTNRDEFKEQFQHNPIVFFSHHEKAYQKLIALPTTPSRKLAHFSTLGALEEKLKSSIAVPERTETGSSIFIISTVKDESRQIFEALQKMRFLAGYEFLAENITGGAGKNIYKANKKQKKIVIGGYNFLMMCYAQKVHFDEILVWNIR
ncbi:MAG: hypothetical protein LBP53_01535 [Candidatus Peribacteria bacterium]|jgi:hypothetical protein|nr:hypothetical protein [Candidatus Peribacteria bacterium]